MKKSRSSASIVKEDYDSDLALIDSESEREDGGQAANGENQLTVEKILGRKFIPTEQGTTEEMYYIKWKGMSYLHASWERREDIEVVDLSAKQKIKRFLQSPLPANILGIPKDQRSLSTEENGDDENGSSNIEEEEVEYFNPELVEVQRIISCDSTNPSHAKAKTPSELIKQKGKKRKVNSSDTLSELDDEESNVRYLVKWRGLPYDECTWERWEELKPWYQEVWLFWYLQRPHRTVRNMQAHPEIKEYKKLDESPVFGESHVIPLEEDMEPTGGLQLRDYQLEGVNWLLWNWWHRRPCILADEMGLGKRLEPPWVLLFALNS